MHNKFPLRHARARGDPPGGNSVGRGRAEGDGGRGDARVLPETDRPQRNRVTKRTGGVGGKNPGERRARPESVQREERKQTG
jgi:hypothetical protein